MMKLFERSWKGEASLAAAFWLVYFLGSIVIAIILSIIFSFTVADFRTPEMMPYYSNVIKAIMFPYTLFSAICVWRCAKNSWILWNVLARIIAVLSVVFGIYYILSALRIM